MDRLLTQLRAAAEPTRLRLLALAARGSFCVSEFTEILGQSQPRLSRHLRLLCEAGLLERVREGANVWFTLPESTRTGAAPGRAATAGADAARQDRPGGFAGDLLARLPEDDPLLAADRRQAARVLAERARTASESFQRRGADWDEMRALGLPAEAVEAALLRLLTGAAPASADAAPLGRVLDIGTGTGRVLEVLAPFAAGGIGVDASRAMLALARARLARPDCAHLGVRQADMYRLPFAEDGFDLALLHMVLHHAEDPEAALAEAARVLRPGGRLTVVDLAPHDPAVTERLAHRWPGFAEPEMRRLLEGAGLRAAPSAAVQGPRTVPQVRLWCAEKPAPMPGGTRAEAALVA